MRLHTSKELREVAFWASEKARDNYRAEAQRVNEILRQFSCVPMWDWTFDDMDLLEIGTGPLWGMLPYFPDARRAVAVDPLIEAYDACGLLEPRGDIQYYSEYFEFWDAGDQRFDVILTANALDHGDLGFHLILK